MLTLLNAVNALKTSLELDLAYVIANPRKVIIAVLPLIKAIQAEATGLSSTDQHYIADLVGIITKLSTIIAAISPPIGTPAPKPIVPVTPAPVLPPAPVAPVVPAPAPAPVATPPVATSKPVAPVVTPAPAPVAPVAPVAAPVVTPAPVPVAAPAK